MRIITVKIPDAYLRDLDELVKTGLYPSRSEAIRTAVRELLRKELHKPIDEGTFHRTFQNRPRYTSKYRDFGY
ncbi:MAG: ribbon-helix-helix domain-containing protein [Candidatus Nezhaarchaeales archaeon]